jgi:hypothetical protein
MFQALGFNQLGDTQKPCLLIGWQGVQLSINDWA